MKLRACLCVIDDLIPGERCGESYVEGCLTNDLSMAISMSHQITYCHANRSWPVASSFCRGEPNIRVSPLLNCKVKELFVSLILNLEERVFQLVRVAFLLPKKKKARSY